MTLTAVRPGQTMQGMLRVSRALVSTLVVLGVLASAWATCVAAATMPEQAQMACCKAAGHHDCGPKGTPADCCKKTASPESQWTVAKADPLKAPLRPFLALLTAFHPLSRGGLLVARSPLVSGSPPVVPLGPPLYIAFSTFLI